MTSDTVRPDTRLPSLPRRLACAETWAGSGRVASLVELPGMVAWVQSLPAGSGEAGGDVHYVSVCPSCLVCRVALADVSGHGQAVVAVGEKLRELMHRHLRALEQVPLMRDLNRVVRAELDGVHYATMAAVGWHGRRGLLVLTNAGHPPPCCYRAGRDEWNWLENRPASQPDRRADLPLGLLADVQYYRTVLRPQVGDLVVLYTDGASEATNPHGDELGRDRLIDMAREGDPSSAEAFGTELTARLHDFRGGVPAADDQTIIVLQRVAPDHPEPAGLSGEERAAAVVVQPPRPNARPVREE